MFDIRPEEVKIIVMNEVFHWEFITHCNSSEEEYASVTLTSDWAVNGLTSVSKEYRNQGVAIE